MLNIVTIIFCSQIIPMIDTICTPSSTDEKAKAFVPFSVKTTIPKPLQQQKTPKLKSYDQFFVNL